MTLICVLYVLIGIKLKNSKTLQGITRDSGEINRSISGQTRIIRMLSKYQIIIISAQTHVRSLALSLFN